MNITLCNHKQSSGIHHCEVNVFYTISCFVDTGLQPSGPLTGRGPGTLHRRPEDYRG